MFFKLPLSAFLLSLWYQSSGSTPNIAHYFASANITMTENTIRKILVRNNGFL
jgi:hypothetical protein